MSETNNITRIYPMPCPDTYSTPLPHHPHSQTWPTPPPIPALNARALYHIHHTHTSATTPVSGTAVTTYTHQFSLTRNVVLPSPAGDGARAKKLVPKRLLTKVAGRKSMVNVAMVFMAEESLRISRAMRMLVWASRLVVRL